MTEAARPRAISRGEHLHLQTRRPLVTLLFLLGGLAFAWGGETRFLQRVLSLDAAPLRVLVALYVFCLLGAALTVRRGVHHPRYLLFNCGETLLLTVGAGGLIAWSGHAGNPLWFLYFSTAAHAAHGALYRRFNLLVFSTTPLLIAGGLFFLGEEAGEVLLALGIGGGAFFLYRLLLSAVDREQSLLRERDQLRDRVAELAVSEERVRIARDLHDGLGAGLNAAIWQVRRAPETPAREEIEHRLMVCMDELGALVWTVRREDTTPAAFWSHLRARSEDLFGAEVRLVYELPEEEESPAAPLLEGRVAAAGLFIAFEALRNAVRHARPSTLTLRGRVDALGLHLEIDDDGGGFQVEQAPRGHGLTHMEERARGVGGELGLSSTPTGTRVRVRLPVNGG